MLWVLTVYAGGERVRKASVCGPHCPRFQRREVERGTPRSCLSSMQPAGAMRVRFDEMVESGPTGTDRWACMWG